MKEIIKNTTVLSSFRTYLYPFCQGTNFNERMICMKWYTKIYQQRTYIARYLINKSCFAKCKARVVAWFEGQWAVSFRFFWNPVLQSSQHIWSLLQSSLHTNGNISTWYKLEIMSAKLETLKFCSCLSITHFLDLVSRLHKHFRHSGKCYKMLIRALRLELRFIFKTIFTSHLSARICLEFWVL
jgi:hypothetical protein